MVETYKYKSKIATAISFIAMFIAYLGKDGLAQIIPAEYAWLIPPIVGIAAYIVTQSTEDRRVDVAEQMLLEKFANILPTEDVDPASDYETLNDEYTTGDAEDES